MKFIQVLILVIALLLGDFAYAHKVIGISDGDTMTLLVDSKPLKIRLANIDAPEKRQNYGQKSKESLSEICWGTDATFETQTIDRYGRTVAVVFCNGIEANKEQVRKGMAWVFKKYTPRTSNLFQFEIEAKNAKIGLWEDKYQVPPWEFRKQKKI